MDEVKESCANGYTGRKEGVMNIIKGDSVYTVTESRDKWKVSKDSGKLSLSVDVSKELCKTWDELREYVLSNDLF